MKRMGITTQRNGVQKHWDWPAVPKGYEFRVQSQQLPVADLIVFTLTIVKKHRVLFWLVKPVVTSPVYALANVNGATEEDVIAQVMDKADALLLDLTLALSPS